MVGRPHSNLLDRMFVSVKAGQSWGSVNLPVNLVGDGLATVSVTVSQFSEIIPTFFNRLKSDFIFVPSV